MADFMVEVVGDDKPAVRHRTFLTAYASLLTFVTRGEEPRAKWKFHGTEWPEVFKRPLTVFDEVRAAFSADTTIGLRVRVQRRLDGKVMVITRVREPLPTVELGANPKLEVIYAVTHDRFKGNLRDAGVFLCRCVDQPGPCVVSRHGYQGVDNHGAQWRGGAWDVFVINGGMEELKRVARFIVAKTLEGVLDARTVIVDTQQWKNDGLGWRPYSGNRHFHVHVDVDGGAPCSP